MTVGIDVAKATFDVAILLEKRTVHSKFENNTNGFKKLVTWLKKYQMLDQRICMEATGYYTDALASYLHEQGISVSIVNPLRIKHFAKSMMKRAKTDRVDAEVIAHFNHATDLSIWTPPTAIMKELKECIRYRYSLVEMRKSEKKRLHAGFTSKVIMAIIRAQIKAYDKQIVKIEKRINKLIQSSPELEKNLDLLCSIKGVGHITAVTFLIEIGDITRFENVGQVVAYCGLAPSVKQSGSSLNRNGRICKMGNKQIRRALYMPAMTAITHNPMFQKYAERLLNKGKHKRTIIVAVMRKLLHVMFGILKTQKPFDPNYSNSGQMA